MGFANKKDRRTVGNNFVITRFSKGMGHAMNRVRARTNRGVKYPRTVAIALAFDKPTGFVAIRMGARAATGICRVMALLRERAL